MIRQIAPAISSISRPDEHLRDEVDALLSKMRESYAERITIEPAPAAPPGQE